MYFLIDFYFLIFSQPLLSRCAPPIFEGKEPPQFVATFQHLVVLKGGLSSGYKNRMTEKGSSDGISCTYSSIRKISDALCFNKAETVRMEAKGVQDKGLIYTIKVTSTKTRSNKLGITKRIHGIFLWSSVVCSVWWLLER
ncbi:hypothetical protein ISN45_Aa05g011200 [Arabidopsis thaliana x Arabidopsis arenosa]|uniref:Uncharacterized protein n=1 Tax=Arabidopsis thaliana x Arabidopsis arenosa TaxID=1240361 RepID=A0A8T1ZJ95_9BRAS|nr:hypothetical protein ISN45_Aa05g011200 [Arabidopsis thaliana x Arabidopsis arenosa]